MDALNSVTAPPLERYTNEGRGGFPGVGGGSSIAVFAEASYLRIVGCDLAPGTGGAGGAGGSGSVGQNGLGGKSGQTVSGEMSISGLDLMIVKER